MPSGWRVWVGNGSSDSYTNGNVSQSLTTEAGGTAANRAQTKRRKYQCNKAVMPERTAGQLTMS